MIPPFFIKQLFNTHPPSIMYSRGGFNYGGFSMSSNRSKAASAGLPYAASGFDEPSMAQVIKKHRTEQE